MREFIVEVPAFVRVALSAEDLATAGMLAGEIVEGLFFDSSLERVGGAWQFIRPELVPVDADEAQPDVYVCVDGELSYLSGDGPEPTGELCPG